MQRDQLLQNVSTSGNLTSSVSVPGIKDPIKKSKETVASDSDIKYSDVKQKVNSSQGTSAQQDKPVVSPPSLQKGNSSLGTSVQTEKAHNKTVGKSLSTQDFNQIEASYLNQVNALMSSLDMGMRKEVKEFFKTELRANDQVIEAL